MNEDRVKHQLQGFLNAPALWKKKELFGLEQFAVPKITLPEDLNISAEAPTLHTNFVLGKRVESFLEILINHCRDFEILAQNIQVHREKITLGEIDFLLKDLRKNQDLHLELVYKFYVYDPSFPEEAQRWIGPNRKDSLLQKVEKLKIKQLPLLFRSETQEFLRDMNLQPETFKQQVCFKANLFVPKNFMDQHFKLINPACIVGFWIHFADFKEEEYGENLFFCPAKQDWPVLPQYNQQWLAFSEILQQIKTHHKRKKSPLLWMKNSQKKYELFFVVWW